jgi:6-phosphogluconolactonase
MSNPVDLHSYASRASLIFELSAVITDLLQKAISKNGRASLAVSGGSTPVQLFEHLSKIDLTWEKVDVCLVDERWVSPDDKDSNEHLVKTHLLQNKAADARFIGMKNDAETAGAGEAQCEEQLKTVKYPIDILILGMGGDGHTASLFPGAEKLPIAVDMDSGKLCMAIAPVTAPHERMTLTLPAIIDAEQIFLHITGQEKMTVLNQAFTEGPVDEMPIRYILQQTQTRKTPFSIYWAQ